MIERYDTQAASIITCDDDNIGEIRMKGKTKRR